MRRKSERMRKEADRRRRKMEKEAEDRKLQSSITRRVSLHLILSFFTHF